MKKDLFIISAILGIIASAIGMIFKLNIGLGILLGTIFSLLYFYLLNVSYKTNEDGTLYRGSIVSYFLRLIVIAIPLLVSCLLPDIFNIFASFGGIMLFRIIMIISFFKQKGEI